ncbi:MAG: hypothetical protein RL341_2019 [Pseudomonadota bacterium]|jgi:hypothetical protein
MCCALRGLRLILKYAISMRLLSHFCLKNRMDTA